MTAMWFGLAAIALAGAGALLYFDQIQRQRTGRMRKVWAKAQNYAYTPADPQLPRTWRRAALAKQDYLNAVDIVAGQRRGESFLLFDLEDAATIVAVKRSVPSDVDIDLRLKSAPPPRDTDLELLGAVGPRVVFANDLDIARRICDQRMVVLTETLPEVIQLLWSEGSWTLASLPIASDARDWDDAIEAVTRLSGILHALPPPRPPRPAPDHQHDPGRPQPAAGRPAPERVMPPDRSASERNSPSGPRLVPPPQPRQGPSRFGPPMAPPARREGPPPQART